MPPDDDQQRWQKLCELASVEKDSKRLSELIEEIIQLIDARRNPPSGDSD